MGVVIASVPAGHVYVRHLDGPGGSDRVVRLPDPPVADGSPAAQWWPPAMLEADWVRAHADEFDVMHVHFGFDHQSPEALRQLTDALAEHRKPLVLTVHDLRNPHHGEPELHDAQLGVLVSAAAALITLTPGAAAEIRRRGDAAPTCCRTPTSSTSRPCPGGDAEHDGFVIGVHVKSLRANMDPLPVIEQIVGDLPGMPGASLRVDAHTDVMRHDGRPHQQRVAAGLARLAAAGRIDLHVHDYFTDDELWDYLSSLDVSVLPYRFGTHSGWLEACFDLGTIVLAPDCGYYAEQRPCVTYAVPGTASAAGRAHADRGAAPGLRGAPGLACRSRCPPGGTTRPGASPRGDLRRSPGRERRMHVVMIAASRFPLKEPFAGGLESLTWNLCRGLRDRGIRVSVFAGRGSDPRLGVRELATRPLDLSAAARQDVSMPPAVWLGEHHAYLQVMLELQQRDDVDVIHNNSLHHLPVAMAAACAAPDGHHAAHPADAVARAGDRDRRRPAVPLRGGERAHARSWRHVVDSEVVPNGVDVRRWRPGPGRRRPGLGRAPGAREGPAPGDRHRAGRRHAAAPRRPDR